VEPLMILPLPEGDRMVTVNSEDFAIRTDSDPLQEIGV